MIPRSQLEELVDPPRCGTCHGTGRQWDGCGCGPGVKHIVDCGRRPPVCRECNGRGHLGREIPAHAVLSTALDLYALAERLLEDLRSRELTEVQPDVRWIEDMLVGIRR